MNDRSFLLATNAVYNFWLYELCDVFIVSLLIVIYQLSCHFAQSCSDESGSDEAHDGRLCISRDQTICSKHPVHLLGSWPTTVASLHALRHRRAMAKITQEAQRHHSLYHGRLIPRYCQHFSLSLSSTFRILSITDSPLTNQNPEFHYPDAEKDFDTVFATLRSIRSLAASYSIQTNIQATIVSASPNESAMLTSQTPTIVALVKGCKSATVVPDATHVPEGCGSAVLSPTLTVYLLVKVNTSSSFSLIRR